MPREEAENYLKNAYSDALDMIESFVDQIVDQLEEKGEASDDLNNDYREGDRYHHETHVDRSYNLLESAQVVTQLRDHEADDSGLWEGVDDPERALEIKAAYTYGNAVMDQWREEIEDLNEEFADLGTGRLRGPKEWSPKREKGPDIKAFVKDWLKRKRKSL